MLAHDAELSPTLAPSTLLKSQQVAMNHALTTILNLLLSWQTSFQPMLACVSSDSTAIASSSPADSTAFA
jgi:hypothetical protein